MSTGTSKGFCTSYFLGVTMRNTEMRAIVASTGKGGITRGASSIHANDSRTSVGFTMGSPRL